MINLNNKGQTLVLFVLMVPIFIILFVFVIDIGNGWYEKIRLSNTCQMAISYGLDDIDNTSQDDLKELILKNDREVEDVIVSIEDNVIVIKLSKKINSIMGNVLGMDIMDITTTYRGEIINKEKKIERIK